MPTVKSWTVAVPYRQTVAEVNEARAGGAQVVEMEIASLYAAAQALDMKAAAVVVISDISQVDGWKSDWSDTVAPPGHKGVSYVAKVEHGVKRLKEGDRVAGAAFASRNHRFCAAGSIRMQEIVRIVAVVGNDARKVKQSK